MEGAIFVNGKTPNISFTNVLGEIEAEPLFLSTGISRGEKRFATMYELPTLHTNQKFISYSFGYLPVETESEIINFLDLPANPVFGKDCKPSGYYGCGGFSGGIDPTRALYWYDVYLYGIKKKVSIVCFPPVRYPAVTNIRNTFVYFDFYHGWYVVKAGNKLMENGQYYTLKEDFPLGEID